MRKAIILMIALLMTTITTCSLAEEETVNNEVEVVEEQVQEEDRQVQIIDIKIVEPEYVPLDADLRPLTNVLQETTVEDREILSRLLWSSPLDDEAEKVKLLWVVFNRINSRNYTFAKMDSIKNAVTENEFPWFDKRAHLSDANAILVSETLENYNAWFAGEDIGEHPSGQGMYISFYGPSNSLIHLYDYNWKELD